MPKTFTETVIKIGKEPMVLMPLWKWEEIKEMFDDLEDARRYGIAFQERSGGKKTRLHTLKKKYGL